MKFFLLLVLVLLVVWLLRGSRRLDPPAAKPADPPGPAPHEVIVACAQCGLLLPAGEALPGRGGGVFCSDAHRVAFEKPQS